jgi:peptide/nickel transport system substrate-binding protein
MKRWLSLSLATAIMATAGAAVAQAPKQGGIMRAWQRDSPGSASIHEEATYSTNFPFMGIFSNLVIYKQDVAQNSMDSIVPNSRPPGSGAPTTRTSRSRPAPA